MHRLLSKSAMEKAIVAFFILLMVVLSQLQLISGIIHTPPHTVYLGTVHFSTDYFYYLAQFVQGKTHFLTSTILFTPEDQPRVLIWWPTVLSGRIYSALGIGVTWMYQLSILFNLILFLVFGYLVLREIFPDSRLKRIIAFLFFISSTNLFTVTNSGGHLSWSYYSYWYNAGNAFSRFGPTPHHLMANFLSLAVQCSVLIWWRMKKKKPILLIGIALAAFTASSITPVQWMLALAGLSAGTLYTIFRGKRENLRNTLIPVVIAVISGVFPAFYLISAFKVEPYVQAAFWEAQQRVTVDPMMLWQGSGLIMLFTAAGLLPFLLKPSAARMVAAGYVAVAALFYMTGISKILNMTNVRFWTPVVYLFLGAIGAEGIVSLSYLTKKLFPVTLGVILLIYAVSILPTEILQYSSAAQPQGGEHVYMPEDAYSVFKMAEDNSSPDDVFLVEWPYNEPFAALTGRRVLYGFYLYTINADRKNQETTAFLNHTYTDAEAKFFLNKYKLKYLVLNTSQRPFVTYPFLKIVYTTPVLTLYRII